LLHKPKILAVGSAKGGVGKSTVAAYLALALQQLGQHVGVIDADIYGPSQATILGLQQLEAKQPEPKPNVTTNHTDNSALLPYLTPHGLQLASIQMFLPEEQALIIRAPIAGQIMQMLLQKIAWQGPLDFLIIDLPPGTGDIPLSIAQRAQLDGVIIVSTPQALVCRIANKALQMFRTLNLPILGIVENMQGLLSESAIPAFLAQAQLPCLAQIPFDPAIALAADTGQSLPVQLASSFQHLAEQVLLAIHSAPQTMQALPEQLQITADGQQLSLTWPTQAAQLLPAASLRAYCPCALCKTKQPAIAHNIRLCHAHKVGHFGLNLHFSDGHNSGIFSYQYLQSLAHVNTTT
jgi:Mrp family chromosome partitioning ATPase/DUF971 family protein